MSKFRIGTKSTWKPEFHYPVEYAPPGARGESSGEECNSDEEMEEAEEAYVEEE